MADDDDQGTSSGSRPKLLLPKAPGPAQPLSHVASRHRKKLDAKVWLRHLHYTHNISGEAPPVVIKNKKKVVVIDESQKE